MSDTVGQGSTPAQTEKKSTPALSQNPEDFYNTLVRVTNIGAPLQGSSPKLREFEDGQRNTRDSGMDDK